MNPLNMLRVARAMGAELKNVVIVGCEPETLGPEEGLMGLSEPVAQAVPRAVALVEHLISRRTS
jgi:hydrogenase maturation protease